MINMYVKSGIPEEGVLVTIPNTRKFLRFYILQRGSKGGRDSRESRKKCRNDLC